MGFIIVTLVNVVWHVKCPRPHFTSSIEIINVIFIPAMGGQRGQEEDEQKQRKSSQYATSKDSQVQQRLRNRNSCLQGGNLAHILSLPVLQNIQKIWCFRNITTRKAVSMCIVNICDSITTAKRPVEQLSGQQIKPWFYLATCVCMCATMKVEHEVIPG